MGILLVGLKTTCLVLKLFGLTLERLASWTFDEMTPHLPSSPYSNLKRGVQSETSFNVVRSNAFFTDEISALSFALSFPACLLRKHVSNFSRLSFFFFFFLNFVKIHVNEKIYKNIYYGV